MINVFFNHLGALHVVHKEHERSKATTYLVNGFNGFTVLTFVVTTKNMTYTHAGRTVFEANKPFKAAKVLLLMSAVRLLYVMVHINASLNGLKLNSKFYFIEII